MNTNTQPLLEQNVNSYNYWKSIEHVLYILVYTSLIVCGLLGIILFIILYSKLKNNYIIFSLFVIGIIGNILWTIGFVLIKNKYYDANSKTHENLMLVCAILFIIIWILFFYFVYKQLKLIAEDKQKNEKNSAKNTTTQNNMFTSDPQQNPMPQFFSDIFEAHNKENQNKFGVIGGAMQEMTTEQKALKVFLNHQSDNIEKKLSSYATQMEDELEKGDKVMYSIANTVMDTFKIFESQGAYMQYIIDILKPFIKEFDEITGGIRHDIDSVKHVADEAKDGLKHLWDKIKHAF